MKILHIANEYGLEAVGGAAEAASRRFERDLADGQDAWFVCAVCNVRPMPRNVIVAGGKVSRFIKGQIVRRVMRILTCPMDVSVGLVPIGLKRVVKRINPDKVFVHWIGAEFLRYEELMSIKRPVTFVLHDFHLIEPPPYRDVTAYDKWILARIKKVLLNLDVDFEAPSHWAARHLKELLPRARVLVSPSPIDPIFRLPITPNCRREHSDKFKILFCCKGGRRNPYKCYGDLETAVEMLPKRLRDKTEIVVVGEGKMLSHVELRDLFYSVDCLAFPSLRETQGLVKCEALACGVPVVAYDRAACAEGVEHKSNGYVASSGDTSGFSDGLLWCAKQSLKI